ncbi:hypothetical protein UO65_3735 [Actinokineospora spheciospongiae]|uniref:Ferric siderophore reductase C-terminal domain-containing protein n=1 Tax=Actinokineospora spheciospongiae TaxID=909613 RepID=W7IW16_9PSEU|nr:(2Fe-2S)-binding protein [Actinokineospora spheciospongiae]EWC61002.1 hypothetical protein UO65_3735 [Actinokineospora spheciospongiae]
MLDAPAVHRLLAERLPAHAGSSTSGLLATPVAGLLDPGALPGRLRGLSRLYRTDDPHTLGTLWWYSASSVVLAPTVESLLVTGTALDPGRVTVYAHPDGRMLAARSDAVCAEPGPALAGVIGAFADLLGDALGTSTRPFWAIAADSLANRVLWAGGTGETAVALAAGVGASLPVPRFVSVGGQQVVRRASCCLVYRAGGAAKCVSCPRQSPEERAARLRAVFGG